MLLLSASFCLLADIFADSTAAVQFNFTINSVFAATYHLLFTLILSVFSWIGRDRTFEMLLQFSSIPSLGRGRCPRVNCIWVYCTN